MSEPARAADGATAAKGAVFISIAKIYFMLSGFVQQVREEHGGVFLFLDTLKGPPSSAGLYTPERRQWLKQQLDKAVATLAQALGAHGP